MKLVRPTIIYKESYIEALGEAKNETGSIVLHCPKEGRSFEDFIQEQLNYEKGLNLPENWVPYTEFWLIDKNEFIGRVPIRHHLTEHLLKLGGHIGYYIRPSKRKMGYGKKILELALVEAKKLGLSKVLVTCDITNLGSQKIIERNKGVLENIIEIGKDKPLKRRYWITL